MSIHSGLEAGDPVLRRLHAAFVLCAVFLIVEVIGGYVSGSLAVLSDAAHLVADLTSFGVAIIASHLANMPSSPQHTYGLKRTESLAALMSMVSLALVSIGLAWEALRRLFLDSHNEVDGPLMSLIAFIGVLVNVALALVLGENHVHLPGHSHDHSHDHHGGCSSHSQHEHSHDHNKQAVASSNGNSHSHDHGDHLESQAHDHGHSHAHGDSSGCESHQHHEETPLIEHVHEVHATEQRHEGNVNLRVSETLL